MRGHQGVYPTVVTELTIHIQWRGRGFVSDFTSHVSKSVGYKNEYCHELARTELTLKMVALSEVCSYLTENTVNCRNKLSPTARTWHRTQNLARMAPLASWVWLNHPISNKRVLSKAELCLCMCYLRRVGKLERTWKEVVLVSSWGETPELA
jgi:hypothetical protein